MLLIRYLIEDYAKQSIEIRADIYTAIKEGYIHGMLSNLQVQALALLSRAYPIAMIANELGIAREHAIELLNAALRYIEEKTQYLDAMIIYALKKEVRKEWIIKAEKIAKEWD